MKRFTLFAAMLAIAASCTVTEIDNDPEVEPILGSENLLPAPDITASYEGNATKTTITTDSEGIGTIWWTPGNEINVFYGAKSTHYTSQNTENTTSAVFSTTDEISEEDLNSGDFWGLYPYDADARYDVTTDHIITTIPTEQKAVEGTFDEGLFLSVARSYDTDLKFYNVLGGIKFSLSRDDIREITFKGNQNEKLAGIARIGMTQSTASRPKVYMNPGEKTITLTPKEGKTFKSGKNYYIVMSPVTLDDGFTMTFFTGTSVGTLNYSSKSIEIKRSVFKTAANIDQRAEFTTHEFTINAVEDNTILFIEKVENPDDITLEYRINDGEWQTYTIMDHLRLSADDRVQFRAGEDGNTSFSKDIYNYYHFQSTNPVNVSGNIMSLLDRGMNVTSLPEGAFCQLFFRLQIVDASHLILPAVTLSANCYNNMFKICDKMTKAPVLPATTLASRCYYEMFYYCNSLRSAPELPATVLAEDCYRGMFSQCTNLTEAPELPATTLADYCYTSMFSNCRSLTEAPELPATTLAGNCYYSMFSDCASLTEAPELPATTLAGHCYARMFINCTNLTKAPELPANNLTEYCYDTMFKSCSSLTEAPELSATHVAEGCYQQMFANCTSLKSIKVEFTSWETENKAITSLWLNGASATGTFYCPSSLSMSPRNINYVPAGWEVRYTTLPSKPTVGDKVFINGVEGMYVGTVTENEVEKKLFVATKNLGAETVYGKGTTYTRTQLAGLTIHEGWELPTAADMEILAALGFTNDSTNDGTYNSTYGYFIPYTQDVADSKREGRLWVVGGTDNDFYWFRSDNAYGLTTQPTANPKYYVRLVKKL